MNQIMEINKVIVDYYEREMKTLIKNRTVFKLDSESLSLIRNKDENEENDLVSMVSCGSSRKPNVEKTEKKEKEDCIIF